MDKADDLHTVAEELEEKYKDKNRVFSDCKGKRKEIQDKLHDLTDDISALDKQQISEIEKVLGQILVPKGNGEFEQLLEKKRNELEGHKQKLLQQKERVGTTQAKLDELGGRLEQMPKQLMTTEHLREIKAELEKLKMDLDYQKEQLAGQQFELEELLLEAKQLDDKSKKILEQEGSKLSDMLGQELGNLEKLDNQAKDLLNQYQDLIQQGQKIDDDSVKDYMKELKLDAGNIKRDLNQLERHKK